MIHIVKVEEQEVLDQKCYYCDQPFSYNDQEKTVVLEIDNGVYYLHMNCAKKFGNKLVQYAT